MARRCREVPGSDNPIPSEESISENEDGKVEEGEDMIGGGIAG